MRRSSSRYPSFRLFLLPFTIICPRLSSIVSYRLLSHISTVVDMSIPRDHRHTMRRILLCLYILSCLLHATAISFTTLDEKILYFVTWGKLEFYSLDLTRSWDAAKAPLETLPPPPMASPYKAFDSLAVNYDKTSLLYFGYDKSLSTYNITTKLWQIGKPPSSPPNSQSDYGYQVATDPSTGIAYISRKESFMHLIYSYNTFEANPNITSTQISGSLYENYGVVWSTVRKSLLFYGGVTRIPSRGYDPVLDLMEYQPSNGLWTIVKTQGATTPGPLSAPCMASAYSGTKIVMYGNDKAPWSVYILDVKTLVWTKGADTKQGQERTFAGCTVVGDHFIVAGGTNAADFSPFQLIRVYNIKLDQWTDLYEVTPKPTVSTGLSTGLSTSVSTGRGNSISTGTSSPVAEGQPSDEGMPLGAKIGIIAGGSLSLVLLLSCGAFLIHRRRMRKSGQINITEKDLPIANLGSTKGDKNNDNNDNNDNTDDTDKSGDDIHLRDILSSLNQLTNRFGQQHGNQGERAVFKRDEMDELYKEDPNYPPYSGEDMEPYSSPVLDLEYEGGYYDPYEYAYHPPPPMGNSSFPTNPNAYIPPPLEYSTHHEREHGSNRYFNTSTLESSENRQPQPAIANKAPRDAISPSPDDRWGQRGAKTPQSNSSKPPSSPSLHGLLKPESARNPQHQSSSIPTVAVQQWQCAQQGQDPQYIAPPPSAATKPTSAYYPQQDTHNDHGGYHDRLDHRAYYHDQRPHNPQEGRDHYNRAMDYSASHHDRRPNGPQLSSGDPNDDDDYLAMYQDPRMNAPEVHGHPSNKKNDTFFDNQRRLDPQDHTRHSTASHLEFYQARPYNNPQGHSNQVDQGDDTLYPEIQRIRAQQEQYMLQRQNKTPHPRRQYARPR